MKLNGWKGYEWFYLVTSAFWPIIYIRIPRLKNCGLELRFQSTLSRHRKGWGTDKQTRKKNNKNLLKTSPLSLATLVLKQLHFYEGNLINYLLIMCKLFQPGHFYFIRWFLKCKTLPIIGLNRRRDTLSFVQGGRSVLCFRSCTAHVRNSTWTVKSTPPERW
jgi:hypothetical protein